MRRGVFTPLLSLFLETGEIACSFVLFPYVPFFWIEGESIGCPPRSPPGGYDMTTTQVTTAMKNLNRNEKFRLLDKALSSASASTVWFVERFVRYGIIEGLSQSVSSEIAAFL